MLNNIVIVGQGAIGLLWYHHLSQHQVCSHLNISLLASTHSLNEHDEYTFTPYSSTAVHPKVKEKNHILRYSNQADIEHANIIILCLKSYHIAKALEEIAPSLNSQCLVILAHNGMGTLEQAKQLLPSNQTILAMLTTHGCLRNAPLNITHTGLGQTDIGLLSGELANMQQLVLTELLNSALPNVIYHQDIVEKQWMKLAINCVINPITALNNIDNGEVCNDRYQLQVTTLLTEIVAISQAERINLVFDDLYSRVYKVAQATAKNCSSMRCDMLADRLTEVDYINGYIHRLGIKNNIATPENTRMWQQVLALKATH